MSKDPIPWKKGWRYKVIHAHGQSKLYGIIPVGSICTVTREPYWDSQRRWRGTIFREFTCSITDDGGFAIGFETHDGWELYKTASFPIRRFIL